MSLDVKALRALLDHSGCNHVEPDAQCFLADALVANAPALLDLADAVRELEPLLARIDAIGGPAVLSTERDAARRVLAILDPTNEGDGR